MSCHGENYKLKSFCNVRRSQTLDNMTNTKLESKDEKKKSMTRYIGKIKSLSSFPSAIQSSSKGIRTAEKLCSEICLSSWEDKTQKLSIDFSPTNNNSTFEAKNHILVCHGDNFILKSAYKVNRSQAMTNMTSSKNESRDENNRSMQNIGYRRISLKEKASTSVETKHFGCENDRTGTKEEIRSLENGAFQSENKISKTNLDETCLRSFEYLKEKCPDSNLITDNAKVSTFNNKGITVQTEREINLSLGDVALQKLSVPDCKIKMEKVAEHVRYLVPTNSVKLSQFQSHSGNEINFDDTSLLIEAEALARSHTPEPNNLGWTSEDHNRGRAFEFHNRSWTSEAQNRGQTSESVNRSMISESQNQGHSPENNNRGRTFEAQNRGRLNDDTEEILVDARSNNNNSTTATTDAQQQQSNALLRQALSQSSSNQRANQENEASPSR